MGVEFCWLTSAMAAREAMSAMSASVFFSIRYNI